MTCGHCEIFCYCRKWNEINPLTPAGISHCEAIFHARSAFHKSRRDLFRWKSTPKGAFSGADDRTRTCTLARWNLNPMSLPIPPRPQMKIYYHDGVSLSIQSIPVFPPLENSLMEIVQIITHFPLTFREPACKMISGICTLPQCVLGCTRFMITGVTAGGMRFTSLWGVLLMKWAG